MSAQYKIGYLCGFFDPIHAGHIDILREARRLCSHLIVAVGTDEFMVSRKHRETILPFEQRSEIIRSIQYVDEVVPETDLDKIGAQTKYHFDVMIAGDDHENDPIYVDAVAELKKRGVDTVYIKRKRECSSTKVRKRTVEVENGFVVYAGMNEK